MFQYPQKPVNEMAISTARKLKNCLLNAESYNLRKLGKGLGKRSGKVLASNVLAEGKVAITPTAILSIQYKKGHVSGENR